LEERTDFQVAYVSSQLEAIYGYIVVMYGQGHLSSSNFWISSSGLWQALVVKEVDLWKKYNSVPSLHHITM
jgi:hypothetical protein